MSNYTRKTQDEYQIIGYYPYGKEEVCAAGTWAEARQLLKDYRENEKGTRFTYRKVRVPIEA